MNEEMNGKGENNMNGYKLLNEIEAAKVLGCKVSTLQKWRLMDKGPQYIKVGRLVRYSEEDLMAYLESNRVEPANAEVAR
jgi:excisionase family DNA binding protein